MDGTGSTTRLFDGPIRIVDWDDVELPFNDPPSTKVPRLAHLRVDVQQGDTWWAWYYKGLVGYISPAVLANALATYDSHQQNRHRREPVPSHVGKILWGQTLSRQDAEKSLRHGTAEKPTPGNKPD